MTARPRDRGAPAETIGFVEMNGAQWKTARNLAAGHAQPHRSQALAVEQGQGRSMAVRVTLRHDDAEFAHAAFLIEVDGRYKTTEP